MKQARKLNEANLQFNSIVMYGIAGKDQGVKNALATAEMLNKFTSRKIITMNLIIFPETHPTNSIRTWDILPQNRNRLINKIVNY